MSEKSLLRNHRACGLTMMMPATIAMGGIMYGSTVTNSMRLRALGTRRCVHTRGGQQQCEREHHRAESELQAQLERRPERVVLEGQRDRRERPLLEQGLPAEQERRHVLQRVPSQGEERGEEEQGAQHHDGDGHDLREPGGRTAHRLRRQRRGRRWGARRRWPAAAWAASGRSVMLATVPLACGPASRTTWRRP